MKQIRATDKSENRWKFSANFWKSAHNWTPLPRTTGVVLRLPPEAQGRSRTVRERTNKERAIFPL